MHAKERVTEFRLCPGINKATDPPWTNSSSSRQLPAYIIRHLPLPVSSSLLLLLLPRPLSIKYPYDTMYPYPNPPHPSYPHQDSSYPTQQSQPPQPTTSSQQVRDRDQSRDTSHSTPLRVIGVPLNFSTGQFAGKHVRAELIELQKADLGRK